MKTLAKIFIFSAKRKWERGRENRGFPVRGKQRTWRALRTESSQKIPHRFAARYFVLGTGLLIFLLFVSGEIASAATVNITASVTTVCGNGFKEGGEQCDGLDLGNKSCAYLHFDSGSLACTVSCRFDTTSCVTAADIATTTSVSLSGSDAIFTDGSDSAEITLPQNFYTQNLDLELFAFGKSAISSAKPAPSGKSFVGKIYDFIFVDNNGNTVTSILKPATIALQYDSADISGLDESSLEPYIWNSGNSSWQQLSSATLDTANKKVVFNTSTLGTFALFASPPAPQITILGISIGGGFLAPFLNLFPTPTPLPSTTPTPTLSPLPPKNISVLDFDHDGRIGMSELSIMLYYFGKTGLEIAPYDLNHDGMVNIVDISILLYYWTE